MLVFLEFNKVGFWFVVVLILIILFVRGDKIVIIVFEVLIFKIILLIFKFVLFVNFIYLIVFKLFWSLGVKLIV